MIITIETKFKIPDDILTQARSEARKTTERVYILRQTDPAGNGDYILSNTPPEINTSRNSLVATIEPNQPEVFQRQLDEISHLLTHGKTVCIAVPNQSTKAVIRQRLELPQSLKIIGDHPDVTMFSGPAWLIFIYTTLQNSIKKDHRFDAVYYVQGEGLTPLAQTCESENLATLKDAGYDSIQLHLDQQEHWTGMVTWTNHNRRDYNVFAPDESSAYEKVKTEAEQFAPNPLIQHVKRVFN